MTKKCSNKTKSRIAYFIFAVMVFTSFLMTSTVFAASGTEALTTAKNLLSKAAQTGGGLYAVWGLSQPRYVTERPQRTRYTVCDLADHRRSYYHRRRNGY